MKKLRPYFLAIVLMAFVLNSCSAQKKVIINYMHRMPVPPKGYLSDFKEVCRLTKKHFAFWQAKEIDPDSLKKVYVERVAKVKTPEEYGKLLVRYMADLRTGHTRTIFARYSVPCKESYLEGRVFVDTVFEDAVRRQGLCEKAEVLAINGVPLAEWQKKQLPYEFGSTDKFRERATAYAVFHSYTDTLRRYRIRTAEGEKEITLSLKYHNYYTPDFINTRVLKDSIGYLAINSMNDGISEAFEKAYPAVKDLPYLILDLRLNGGGNSVNSEYLASYFIQEKIQACVSCMPILPREDRYRGKLYVLISNRTFSAAESFAIDLNEGSDCLFIGELTGGDTGNGPEIFVTKRGTPLNISCRKPSFSPKGFPMEGKGLEPQIQVLQTADDYLRGMDTVLEAAIGLVQKNKAGQNDR